jgi:hypothetical protein
MTPLCPRTAARNREGIRAHPLTSWSRSPHRSLRDGVRPHGVACTRSRQTAAAKATKAALIEPSSYIVSQLRKRDVPRNRRTGDDVIPGWWLASVTYSAPCRAHHRRGNAYQTEQNRDASMLLTFNPDTIERELAACAMEPVRPCRRTRRDRRLSELPCSDPSSR